DTCPPPGGDRGGGCRGADDRRRGDAPVRDTRRAADRAGGAVPDVQGVRRHLRPPPGRAGTARACRHAVGRVLLAVPRCGLALAPGRARAVGELSLVCGLPYRPTLEPRARARRAATSRRRSCVLLV